MVFPAFTRACSTLVDILDADIRGSSQIEAICPIFGTAVRSHNLSTSCCRFAGKSKRRCDGGQDRTIKKAHASSRDFALLAVHDLFSTRPGNLNPRSLVRCIVLPGTAQR